MKFASKHFIIVTVLFLVGCSGIKTPTGKTSVSTKPYFCRGSWHYPQTYYEYDEVGLASWYGGDFHGKAKASGEIFDKMSMTAAHKTLPIPSVAKVTNMRTGKSVVVVIDDRGPYCYKGRVIDLSYGAAKALDLHRYRPAPVRIQTLVSDSLKLSNYISNCCKKRRDPFGRSWVQLYFQEILGVSMKTYKTQNSANTNLVIKKTKITTIDRHIMKFPSKNNSKKRDKKYNNLGSYLNKF